MKFRDPKTGEVLGNIFEVYERFCGKNEQCSKECPLASVKSCGGFVWGHKREAARLMEYEIIESEDESEDGVEICQKVKEVNMKKKDKPRLAEVLGVEVGERFRVPGNGGTVTFWVTDAGYFDTDPPHLAGSTYMLLNAINHPESIIRAPRLTEAELAIMRDTGTMWVSRADGGNDRVELWDVKPSKTSCGVYVAPGVDPIARVRVSLFPSVHPGDCICVEEAGAE